MKLGGIKRHLDNLSVEKIYDMGEKYVRFTSMEQFEKRPPRQVQTQAQAKVKESRKEEEMYIAPTWSFISVDSGNIFRVSRMGWAASQLSENPLRVHDTEIHERSIRTSCQRVDHSDWTYARFSADEVLALFVVTDNKEWPHLFWDYIVMDELGVGKEVLELYVEKQGEGGDGDEIVREVNTQLRLGVKEKVTKKMLGAGEIIPRPEARNRAGEAGEGDDSSG
tara:strand:- start:137 stop:805 length:669 start_codon:yes stop_codon:yes gene_type:complete